MKKVLKMWIQYVIHITICFIPSLMIVNNLESFAKFGICNDVHIAMSLVHDSLNSPPSRCMHLVACAYTTMAKPSSFCGL